MKSTLWPVQVYLDSFVYNLNADCLLNKELVASINRRFNTHYVALFGIVFCDPSTTTPAFNNDR